MKTKIIILFLLFPALLFAGSPPDQLYQYLKYKDFFRLKTTYNQVQKSLSQSDQLYFEAFITNAFNRCEHSSMVINQLLSINGKILPDSSVIALLELQIDNQVKTYHYAAAAETGMRLIAKYRNQIDSAKLADLKNSNIIWHALATTKPQQIVRQANTTVTWKRDPANLMNIPVQISKITNNFVFDTGANLSTISESYAKQLHLRLIETAFDLGSATSVTNKASLAVAANLRIGQTELKNVVFLVLPDDQLSFPQIHYKINAIIGYPVISQLGEVIIKKNGVMSIPAVPGKSDFHNLAMDGLLPLLAVKTGEDTLRYIFDTGAKQSMLFKPYFDKYRAEIIKIDKPDSVKLGGAGGVVKYQSYRLPKVSFCLAGKFVELTDVDVLTQAISDDNQYYDGTIGQDIIGKFKGMRLNFKDMFIDFE